MFWCHDINAEKNDFALNSSSAQALKPLVGSKRFHLLVFLL